MSLIRRAIAILGLGALIWGVATPASATTDLQPNPDQVIRAFDGVITDAPVESPAELVAYARERGRTISAGPSLTTSREFWVDRPPVGWSDLGVYGEVPAEVSGELRVVDGVLTNARVRTGAELSRVVECTGLTRAWFDVDRNKTVALWFLNRTLGDEVNALSDPDGAVCEPDPRWAISWLGPHLGERLTRR